MHKKYTFEISSLEQFCQYFATMCIWTDILNPKEQMVHLAAFDVTAH